MLIGNHLSIYMEKVTIFQHFFNSEKLGFIAKYGHFEGLKKQMANPRKSKPRIARTSSNNLFSQRLEQQKSFHAFCNQKSKGIWSGQNPSQRCPQLRQAPKILLLHFVMFNLKTYNIPSSNQHIPKVQLMGVLKHQSQLLGWAGSSYT